MAPVEAERHFAERLREIKANIQGLSLAEQFRLVADFVDAGKAVAPELVLSLARYAVAELERRGR